MSDLEAAIAAEMKRQGCDRYDFDSDIPEVSGETTCEQHEAVWDEDRDACPVVADAVCAGWDAAINAAAEKAQDEINQATQEQARIAPSEVGHYRANGGVVAGFRIRDAITALLSEGGN